MRKILFLLLSLTLSLDGVAQSHRRTTRRISGTTSTAQKRKMNSANKQNTPSINRNEVIKGIFQNMIFVDGGSFMMGEPKDIVQFENNEHSRPVHRVTLSPFFICKYETTYKEWIALMGSTPQANLLRYHKLNEPVAYASYNMVQEFISKLCTLIGRTFRLPTEAEWEYAAKGGNKEWVSDWWGKYYKLTPQTNPQGPTKEEAKDKYSDRIYKVCRDFGGFFSKVYGRMFSMTGDGHGLRLALSPKPSDIATDTTN